MNEPTRPSTRDQRLQELIAAYLEAEQAGQPPEAEAWLAGHADLAALRREAEAVVHGKNP